MKHEIRLTGTNLVLARQLLLKLIDLLDDRNIVYHLEGGTLLGIVRDGDLLPWDHDFDLSIMRKDVVKFYECVWFLRRRLWRVGVRKYTEGNICWDQGDTRLFRLSKRRKILFWEKADIVCDLFVKDEHDNFVYWMAKNKIMRVDKKHYESYDEIDYFGRKVKVPNFHEEYLEQKYGDWRIPVKEWNCATDELTVIGSVD